MEQPNSPGTGQVDLRDCIDPLLKFVIESHIDETLELDLGLSRDYCCNLLREDSRDQGEGVHPSPSYKRLALLLHELIITCTNGAAWREMLADKGSELVDVFKAINFELHVQEPFFTQLKDGLKTIEGRCATGNYKRIAAGALVLFNKCLVLEVEDVRSYNSFSEMLVAEGLQNVLPGVKTTEEGRKLGLMIGVYLPITGISSYHLTKGSVSVYRNFYTEEKERSNGVVAICVTRPASQPYNILASIISKLSSSGIESILSNTSHAALA